MGIAVEEADHEELMEIGVDQNLREPRAVDRGVADAQPAAHLLHQHGLGIEIVDHVRNVEPRPSAEGFAESADAACLLPKVRFLAEIGPDLVDDAERLVALEAWCQHQDEAAYADERVHVAIDLDPDAGATDLDDDGAPVRQASPVHLGDRGRCHRFRLERPEDLLDRSAERDLDRMPRFRAREGRDVVLQPAEFGEPSIGQQVAAQAERLPELHEGRAKPLERDAKPARQLRPLGRRAAQALDRRRAEQAGGARADSEEPAADHEANARWAVLMARRPPP